MTQDVQVMEQTTPEETTGRRFVSLEEGFMAAEAINKAVLARGGPIMTMDEINEEIAACRRERREREQREREAANERAYCL